MVSSYLPGEGHWRSERFFVQPVCCHDELDYWRGLNEAWLTGATVINLEHDVECSDAHIEELLDCPEPLCTWAYRLHWRSTGLPGGRVAQSMAGQQLAAGAPRADWSGLGLVKVTRDARSGALRREPWQRVELAVADAVAGTWHVHWPEVRHHHW